MRPALIIALLPAFAACGQTGPLKLPDAPKPASTEP